MKTTPYALAVPHDLLKEVRSAAKETGLSMADAMRQSMKLGLPRLREQLSRHKISPMTKEEAERAYGPNPEFDELEAAMSRRQRPAPEPD